MASIPPPLHKMGLFFQNPHCRFFPFFIFHLFNFSFLFSSSFPDLFLTSTTFFFFSSPPPPPLLPAVHLLGPCEDRGGEGALPLRGVSGQQSQAGACKSGDQNDRCCPGDSRHDRWRLGAGGWGLGAGGWTMSSMMKLIVEKVLFEVQMDLYLKHVGFE